MVNITSMITWTITPPKNTKEARKEAGRAGGVAKASKTPSKTVAKSWQNSAPSPSPSPSPNPVPEKEEGGAVSENCFAIYEHEIGPLTPLIADELGMAEKECPEGWVGDALREASKNNKRSWAYAKAILKRWITEGKQSPYKANGSKRPDATREALEKFKRGEL
jgi:DnaD/phage-associated family protein